jgi:phage terminase Nu1 subunit (DNA packaging protein)
MDNEFPWQAWQWVNERAVSQLTGRSLKAIQRDRCRGIGIPFKKLNGATVRYKVANIIDWLEAQPSGGSCTAEHKKKRGSRRVAQEQATAHEHGATETVRRA